MNEARRRSGSNIGQRLRELRESLGWTQDVLSERSGLRRTEISTIEQGRNRGSSWRVRTFLANGFGLSRETLEPYWEGQVPLSEVVNLVRRATSTPAPSSSSSATSPTANRPAGPFTSYRSAEYVLRYPNLYVASRLVSADLGVEEAVAARAAERLASSSLEAGDRPTLQWVRQLEAELGKTGTDVRPNPRAVPKLDAAIKMLVEDSGLREDVVEDAAVRLLEREARPPRDTVLSWVQALQRELEPEPPSDPTPAPPAAGSRRSGATESGSKKKASKKRSR